MSWQVTCNTVNICELWNVDVVTQVREEQDEALGFSAMLIVTGHFRYPPAFGTSVLPISCRGRLGSR